MTAIDDWEAFTTRFLEDTAEDLFDNAPCGYISALPDGTIVKVNQTFLNWTGYERDDINGLKRLPDLLTPGGRIYHETHYAPLLAMQGTVQEIAVDFVRADGTELPALINSVVKTDPEGRPAVVRTTVFDATHRREYERELLRATKRAEESEARAQLLARTLQESLIPPTPPDIDGLDVAAAYRPAGSGNEVGGDFYDVFELAPDDWAVTIGDVEGKGARAASVTALARYTMRAAAMRARRPDVVLSMLNEALLRQEAGRFCTVVCTRLRRDGSGSVSATVSSGGHPMPIRFSPDGLLPEPGQPGDLIGVLEEPELRHVTVDLGAGQGLLFFTDGVPDGRSGSAFFGIDRLRQWVDDNRKRSAAELAEDLVTQVVEFQHGRPRDDIAVVVVKVPT
jgi:sigma-B regulation protein RsbU (phosphoserine phosphatase)